MPKMTQVVPFAALLLAGVPYASTSVQAGEGFLQKFGDGLRHTVESVVKNPVEALPVCWGQPQNCRGEDKKTAQVKVAPQTFSATYRVDCIDAVTGADRADNTITATSTVSLDEARNEIIRRYQTSDLCQANGDTSRITKPGSGRWL